MFTDFRPVDDRPVYIQVKEYLKRMITKGILQADQKLPSTRELSTLLHVSRNTVITAYADLEEEGLIYTVKGKGSFVSRSKIVTTSSYRLDWRQKINDKARMAEEMDLMKHGIRWEKGMISFTSIAPDEKLFDLSNFKRAFLDRISIEGEILLNYGYAKGYKPLMEYLLRYMENKGVDLTGKDILITNGFTEGFDMIVSALSRENASVICENPTHHTAMKILRLNGFEPVGIEMEQDGIHLEKLRRALSEQLFCFAYLIPSYHNPTGIVMSPEKRMAVLNLFAKYQVPIIEDGFNEELRYSGSHVAPLIACAGKGNSVIYLGSFSKILFPGIRVGWILADKDLIDYLESIKRARTIHTSTLDQAVLYQYLHNGNFEKYLKKARSVYKRKYELAVRCCKEFIPLKRMTGDGGLHLFIELEENIHAREVLKDCYSKGVVFTPGDIFFTDQGGHHTLRLGFSRVSDEEMVKGIKLIGESVKKCMREV
ncbi:MocR-like pyridoxine biosynthesis transcription factor PdxR [Thermoflavimicrobium dichotomicum]|uniref:DNA-binding transcriptional regulator, MocR family, contains an aminotransferase domain n=1 Tax=Thermoflavimicrobium dichotomicum TaxID=46223 RepID=A0A1I3SLV7_9BACL|nr:PLP-dependent aminotransferase family protein [Thermoflavimicrobium dichotomicum]SFJ58669.1 DNA-binding transcriptional regulator, MocR family, contains an aminotransferase domain [Thermoflavimicrobium dichotomicum]